METSILEKSWTFALIHSWKRQVGMFYKHSSQFCTGQGKPHFFKHLQASRPSFIYSPRYVQASGVGGMQLALWKHF